VALPCLAAEGFIPAIPSPIVKLQKQWSTQVVEQLATGIVFPRIQPCGLEFGLLQAHVPQPLHLSSRNGTEMQTPGLACANNCVFCHHHANLVATFSRKIDSPEFIVEQALEKHRRMTAQFKGVPGVTPRR
jgi:hypothetical protein